MSNRYRCKFFFFFFFIVHSTTTMRGQEDESVRRTPTRNELSISSSPSNIKEETNDLITWTPEQDACSIVSILMAVEKTLVRYSVGEPRKIRINDDRIKLFSRTGLHLYANNCTCVIYFGTGSCIVSFSFHFFLLERSGRTRTSVQLNNLCQQNINFNESTATDIHIRGKK